MRQIVIPCKRFVAGLALFVVGVAFSSACFNRSEMRFEIPKASWVQIFFKEINSVAKFTGQIDLTETRLRDGDLEARMWWGFGLSPLEGISLRRVGGQWSAIHTIADQYSEPTYAERRELQPPKSGWDKCWQRLLDAGILTQPDASAVNCGDIGLDGIGFVVETNTNRTYRTYMYHNPTLAKCNEAKQMVKIAEIIDEEFTWKK